MSTETPWANPEALRQLRARLELTAEDVASETRKLKRLYYPPVTAEQVLAWEAGRGTPEIEHLEALAEVYQCPVGYFFLGAPPEPAAPLSYRGLAPGKEERFTAATRGSLRRFVEIAEWFVETIEEHKLDWPVRVPKVGGPPLEVELLAEETRRRLGFSESVRGEWQSANDGFEWWRRRIEGEGVFCLQLRLDPKDVRGASVWVDGRYPFILVNHHDAEAATGRLFTLLHEYAHLLFSQERDGITCDFRGREPGQALEPRANRFAARVLLPGQELRRHLENEGQAHFREHWTDQILKDLANRFFVSRDVVAIVLEELQFAPDGFYQRKREQWEQRYARWQPWGRGRSAKKWERKARELGTSGLRMILRLQERGELPALEVAYLLDTKVEKLDRFMEGFRTVVAE